MKVLIGCETSGVMRRAFEAEGHETWSCDLLPSEDNSPRHIIGDIRLIMQMGWDFMLAHPPCTRLANVGQKWLNKPPLGKTRDQIWAELHEAVQLFTDCWNAPINHVVLENPVMHLIAQEMMPLDLIRLPTVQPWWFGDEAFKETVFYTSSMPALVATNKLVPPNKGLEPARYKEWSKLRSARPSDDRWKIRSRSFPGIAAACAKQWSEHLETQRRIL